VEWVSAVGLAGLAGLASGFVGDIVVGASMTPRHPPHVMSHKRVLSDPAIEGPPSPKRSTSLARQRGPNFIHVFPEGKTLGILDRARVLDCMDFILDILLG